MWSRFVKNAVSSFGCVIGIGGALSFIGLLALLIACNSKTTLHGISAILWLDSSSKPKLSRIDQQALHKLIDSGAVISPENIFTHTMAYYDNIIVILVALLGIMGILAFMYARGLSKDHAEKVAAESARQYVSNHFASKAFDKEVESRLSLSASQYLDIQFGALLEDYPLDTLLVKLGKMDEEIEALKNAQNLDFEIVPPPPNNNDGEDNGDR